MNSPLVPFFFRVCDCYKQRSAAQPRRSRSSSSLFLAFAFAALSSLSLFRAPSRSLGMLVMPPPGAATEEEEDGDDDESEESEEEREGGGNPARLDCFPISTLGAPTIPGLSAGPSVAYPADAYSALAASFRSWTWSRTQFCLQRPAARSAAASSAEAAPERRQRSSTAMQAT